MGIVIESVIWQPKPQLYLFIFISNFLSIFLLPYFSKTPLNSSSSSLLDITNNPFPLRLQRSFLILYSFASVLEGSQYVFGEFENGYYGVSREQMVVSLCVGSAAALIIGTLLGMISDIIGQKKICVLFGIFHIFVGTWKTLTMHPSAWVVSICLGLASSVFSFSFETWMVTEYEKTGHRQDLLSETFWLMTFFESASLFGSQMMANFLVGVNAENGVTFPSTAVAFLAIMCIVYIAKGWKESKSVASFRDYRTAFSAVILGDKRILLLACAQGCLHFSITVFWILWAPTIVADGREVNLGLIYPCLMGARMLGSTAVPWFLNGPSPVRTEDYLTGAFIIAGLSLSIVAFDYQEIGILVTLFCLFHSSVGSMLPSLARLRTMYVPNQLRGGMISLSLAPANAAVLIVLIQGGYSKNLENSTIMGLAAFGLFVAAGCMYMLKRTGKQSHQNWHDL